MLMLEGSGTEDPAPITVTLADAESMLSVEIRSVSGLKFGSFGLRENSSKLMTMLPTAISPECALGLMVKLPIPVIAFASKVSLTIGLSIGAGPTMIGFARRELKSV